MSEYSVVGKRLPRLDGVIKATGKAEFSGDLVLPRMLYGKILRSPYPHAKILNIDTSKAEKLTGVKAVITGKDTSEMKYLWFDVRGMIKREIDVKEKKPQMVPDKYPLAWDKVRYIGDELAALAAIDEDTAEEALDLIEAEYEELPAVFDSQEAMKPGAPQIHDHAERNICWRCVLDDGNVEKGFMQSDYIREDTFKTGVVAHGPMEPDTALASFDPSGKLTIWPTCMGIHGRRGALAMILGLPESEVRVINPYVGGAFGSKVDFINLDICAALLSKKAGRPIRIAYTKEEQLTCTRTDYAVTIELKTGVKRDGTLLAQEYRAISNKGAYTGIGPVSTYLLIVYMNGTYRIPHIRYEAHSVYTNTLVAGPKRSHQNPIVRFALESHLDEIAKELGIDPMELRLKNVVHTGDTLPATGKLISCGLTQCIQKTADNLSWKGKRGKLPKDRGIGMGCTYFFGGGAIIPPPQSPSSGAFVKCNADGTVNLLSGYVDCGAGAGTMFAQMAAEELGIHPEDIKVTMGDTEVTPHDISSHLSGVAYVTGNAVKLAAADAKRQLFEIVSEKLEVDIADLEAKDRRIYVKGSPEKGMSFSDVVKISLYEKGGNPIMGKGYYSPGVTFGGGNIETGEGGWSPTYVFANGVAEIGVDRETGKIKLFKIGVAHDCGFAINPMEVEAQLEGSSSMAQGNILWEEIILEKGQVLNPSFLGYKLPLSLDVPEMVSIPVESIDPKGPFGAKEAGEGSTATTVAAIANAIPDAIGVRIRSLPITPDKILEALDASSYSP